MTDDDLSPARGRNRVKTTLKPSLRYAVDMLCQERRLDSQSAALRELVVDGLRANGWTAQRIDIEYKAYDLKCARQDIRNVYEMGQE